MRGWDRNAVRLRVKIVAMAAAEADAAPSWARCRSRPLATAQVSGPEPRRGRSWYASFKLDVPRTQALRLQADNGGLHIAER